MTSKVTIATVSAAAALAVTVAGTIVALDARWVKPAQAAEMNARQDASREVGDLENQLSQAQLEQAFLLDKETRTAQDEKRLAYLARRIELIEERLEALNVELRKSTK